MSTGRTCRAVVAAALVALVAGGCDTARTPTSPAPPTLAGKTDAALRIAAFTVTEAVEGVHYLYAPKLTLTAGGSAVTVVELTLYIGDGGRFNDATPLDPPLPYLVRAGTSQLFANPPAGAERRSIRADWASVDVTFVDESGRRGHISSGSVAIPR